MTDRSSWQPTNRERIEMARPSRQRSVNASNLSTSARVDNSEGMSYLQSLPRRLVTVYLPLSIIVIILLFPFYWMGLTSLKPDEQLLDMEPTVRSGSGIRR